MCLKMLLGLFFCVFLSVCVWRSVFRSRESLFFFLLSLSLSLSLLHHLPPPATAFQWFIGFSYLVLSHFLFSFHSVVAITWAPYHLVVFPFVREVFLFLLVSSVFTPLYPPLSSPMPSFSSSLLCMLYESLYYKDNLIDRSVSQFIFLFSIQCWSYCLSLFFGVLDAFSDIFLSINFRRASSIPI